MKPTILLLVSLILATSIFAQEQTGLVREQNSNKRPVSGVQLIFADAVPTTSDNNGVFTLSFSGKQEGDLVFYEEIRKRGYEIVNEKELEVLKIGRTGQLSTDIILAKAGLVDAAKREYYEVSDGALIAGLNKEKQALRAKLQASRLDQQEYLDQLTALQEQYDIQKESLDALAAKFARINFDDVGPFYQEALELFKAGKVSEAITTLESADPTEQTRKIIAEEKRLSGAQAELDDQKADLAAEKEKQIATVRLLADMYNVNFNPAKAEQQYDQLLLLDGNNLDILQEAADFYRTQHRYEKAKNLYPIIIAHPDAEDWKVADAYCHLGELHTATGERKRALEACESCVKIFQTRYKEKPSSFSKNSLAFSYSRLGDIYTLLNDFEAALNVYQQYNLLTKELYASFPNRIDYKDAMATSYERLGGTHQARGDFETALSFYLERYRLGKELYEADANNVAFISGFAVSNSRLGQTYAALGQVDSALIYYQHYNFLAKEAYASFPNRIRYKRRLATSYAQLGDTHKTLGDLEAALNFYEQYNFLAKELSSSFPNNVDFKNNLDVSYSKLGDTHSALGDLETALHFYQQGNVSAKELHTSFPNDVDYKGNLASSYYKLGNTHSALGDLETASNFHQQSNALARELHTSFPNNIDFKGNLAGSNEKLGIIHAELGNLETALQFHQQSNALAKELYEASPDNVSAKVRLAMSYANFGVFHSRYLNDKIKAKAYYEAGEKLFEELVRDVPQQATFRQHLELVQKEIKALD